ncbi:MAG: LON peptidase substrate-binding domain-containing protein [Pseudomonadales bacterium]
MEHAPLFPLNTLLFPGTRLALKIFEQRYLEMVKDCLKNEKDFVVVLISKGQETGVVPEVFSVGTRARIVDWNLLEGGLLGVVVEGGERVSIASAKGVLGELLIGETEVLDDHGELDQASDAEFETLLQKLEQHPLVQAQGMAIDYHDLNSVMWGLSSLLPFSNTEKQSLLELDDPQVRYQTLQQMLHALEG